uniref:Uncharacterized protein n=1 Tax=Quercus lobata TaxID=97700 RepID=A0A7N2LWP3_QUELO
MAQVSKICSGAQNTQIFHSNPKTQKSKSEKPSTCSGGKGVGQVVQRRGVVWVCDWFGFWILILLWILTGFAMDFDFDFDFGWILLWILILILAGFSYGFCSTEVGGVTEIREK